MRHSLKVLLPGLLLVSCEKPARPGDRTDTFAPAASPERRTHKPRGQAPDAPSSPREIMETADRIEPPAARERTLANIAWNAIETDPGLAHEAFLRLPAESPEKIRLIQHYAMALAEGDVEAALEWAAGLSSELEISTANAQIALTLAETDPRRAANLLSESGIAGRELDVAVVQVMQRWAGKSVPEAAAWVTAFPPGAVREAGLKIISEQWLPRDAPAAFDWLGSLRDEGLRKDVLRAIEGLILQQPQDIGDEWLQHADALVRSELEQQRGQAIKDVGDNFPAPTR